MHICHSIPRIEGQMQVLVVRNSAYSGLNTKPVCAVHVKHLGANLNHEHGRI